MLIGLQLLVVQDDFGVNGNLVSVNQRQLIDALPLAGQPVQVQAARRVKFPVS